MGPAACRVLSRLSDGGFHSGERLARELGLSRTAVWKQVERIRETGLAVESEAGRGYRLPGGLELLDAGRIEGELSGEVRARLATLTILPDVDSTNRWLYAQGMAGQPAQSVCLAEMQTAGRGRRGRGWVSPFGANFYGSVLWRFDMGPTALGGLSLAVGVAAVRALEGLGIEGVGIKWPNDLQWQGRKLAGVLVEVSGESGGPSLAVAGVGINCRMPPAARIQVDQPFAELDEVPGGDRVSRNELAAGVIEALFRGLAGFESSGFESCRGDFERMDLLSGRTVRILAGDRGIEGEALGVDDTGRLKARVAGEVRTFASGEVTIRSA